MALDFAIPTLSAIGAVGRPWHGFGIIKDKHFTVDDACEYGDVGFEVEKRPIYVEDIHGDKVIIPNRFANTRTDNDHVLGIVKKRFKNIQNYEAWMSFDALFRESEAQIETVGSFDNGRIVFMLAKLPVHFEVLPGDEVWKYFLISQAHDGSMPLILQLACIRPVCWNTLQASIRKAKSQIRIKHTKNAQDRLELAKKVLEAGSTYWNEISEYFSKFAAKKVNKRIVKKFVEDLLPVKGKKIPTRTANIRTAVNRAFEEAPGADIANKSGMSVWGLYNGVTYYNDHLRSLRTGKKVTSADRFQATTFGSGTTLREKAFDLCVKLVS